MQKIYQDYSIGENLKKLRKKAKLTQEQVAAKLEIKECPMSRSIYSKIEIGSHSIRVSELIALREIFKCEFNDFFDGLY